MEQVLKTCGRKASEVRILYPPPIGDIIFALLTELKTSENLGYIPPPGSFLNFAGIGEMDVYNITAPFVVGGQTFLAGRVEYRKNDLDYRTVFFREKDSVWYPVSDAPEFNLQDPFVTKIGNEIIFGGIETFPHPFLPYPQGLGYRTRLFKGCSLQSLEPFTSGPDMMKGIRVLELPNGGIFVLTRPQDPWVKGTGPGKIGFTTISSLDGLTPENILKAEIIPGLFEPNEWGGANELHLLPDGVVGVFGHKAYADTDSCGQIIKHYQAIAFKIDPVTGRISPPHIVASRKDFPQGPTKREETRDIVYSGGLIRLPSGLATLYLGLSDAQAGQVTKEDPFLT